MIKTVNQRIIISQEILDLMSKFRNMVNDCIRIGLQNNVTSLKILSAKSYRYLDRYDILSYYKLHAISRASGILQNRKKSIKRGFKTKAPYLKNDIIISCYGFKVDWNNGAIRIPLGGKRYVNIIQMLENLLKCLSVPCVLCSSNRLLYLRGYFLIPVPFFWDLEFPSIFERKLNLARNRKAQSHHL